MDDAIASRLEQRLGRLHAKQRLGTEKDHEAQIVGQRINFFHIENWYSIHSLIRNALKLSRVFLARTREMPNVSRCGTITLVCRGYRVPSMTSPCFISVI
jgi:hypothetical protein